MTMHKALNLKSNVDPLYISQNEGDRALFSLEDTIETSKIGLESYIQESKEQLLGAARRADRNSDREVRETVREYKNRRAKERKENWKEKALHGQFIRQTEETAGQERWKRLENS